MTEKDEADSMTEHKRFDVKFIRSLREWHPTKNGDRTPYNASLRPHEQVWWKCLPQGHEWQARINDRVGGAWCPHCVGHESSFAGKFPEFAKEWHPTKNGTLAPASVFPFERERAWWLWWLCKNGHSWRAPVNHRDQGKSCPFCAKRRTGQGNSLNDLFPLIAKEWHPTRNGTMRPSDVAPGSNRVVWWRCGCSHEWTDIVNRRINGSGCPRCPGGRSAPAKSLTDRLPGLAQQWHPNKNGNFAANDVPSGTQMKIWWLCSCGHEWRDFIYNRAQDGKCPSCQAMPEQDGQKKTQVNTQLKLLDTIYEPSTEQPPLEENTETLTCLLCGVQFPSLTWHLKATHQMSGAAYREHFNLSGDYPLAVPSILEKHNSLATPQCATLIMRETNPIRS
ncbi:MAG: zinc-ribbon domain-containing protein [Chloroflexi bacterium]|nr:zinc-ribbon domain-containing protein [Chloroflexota bacterium]